MEIALIALVALLLFGAGRVASLGKGLGQGIRNFKEGLKEASEEDDDEEEAPKPKKKAKLRVAEEEEADEDAAPAKKKKEA